MPTRRTLSLAFLLVALVGPGAAEAADFTRPVGESTYTARISTMAAGPTTVSGGTRPDLAFFTGNELFLNPAANGTFRLANSGAMTGGNTATTVTFPAIDGNGLSGPTVVDSSAPFESADYTFTTAWDGGYENPSIHSTNGSANNTFGFYVTRDSARPATFAISTTDGTGSITPGQSLSASATDAGAGIRNVSYQWCPAADTCAWGSGSATPIGTSATGSDYAVGWASPPPDSTFKVTARATDNVGNTRDATRTLTTDSTGPAGASAGVVPGSGAAMQFWSSATSTLWYSPRSTGTFTISATGSTPADVATVDFPALNTVGLTGAASSRSSAPAASDPYTFTSSNTVAPGPVDVTLRDSIGNASNATVRFARDTAAPVAGSLSYADGDHAGGPVVVTTVQGNDGSGSGISSAVLERDEAPHDGTGCSAFPGAWSAVATTDSTTMTGRCYRYRYRVTDRVGNQATYASSSVVRRPAGAPPAPAPPGPALVAPSTAAETRPPAAPPAPPSAPVTTSPTAPSASGRPLPARAAAITLLQRAVTLTRQGIARIPLTCLQRDGRCKGKVTIYLLEKVEPKRRGRAASTAARREPRYRKVKIGQGRFDVRAGSKGALKVTISRRGRRRIAVNRRARCRISVTTGGRTSTSNITLKVPKKERK